MPGDIDAGNQSLFGELRYLLEGGIANDKMPSECVRLSNFGMQHIALADLKRNMCAQHRYWRETPQQDQQLRRHASPVPISTPDQRNHDHNAGHSEHGVSRAA